MGHLNINFCWTLVLWTCSKGTFSHSVQISDSNHTHSLANFIGQGSQPANNCPELKLLTVPEMELLQGDGSAFYTFLVQREREKWLIQCFSTVSHNSSHVHCSPTSPYSTLFDSIESGPIASSDNMQSKLDESNWLAAVASCILQLLPLTIWSVFFNWQNKATLILVLVLITKTFYALIKCILVLVLVKLTNTTVSLQSCWTDHQWTPSQRTPHNLTGFSAEDKPHPYLPQPKTLLHWLIMSVSECHYTTGVDPRTQPTLELLKCWSDTWEISSNLSLNSTVMP